MAWPAPCSARGVVRARRRRLLRGRRGRGRLAHPAGVVRPRPRPPPAGGGGGAAAPLEKRRRRAAAACAGPPGERRAPAAPGAAAGPSHPVPAVVRPSHPVPAGCAPAAVRGRRCAPATSLGRRRLLRRAVVEARPPLRRRLVAARPLALRGRLRRAREHGVEGGVVAALRHPRRERLAPAAALSHLCSFFPRCRGLGATCRALSRRCLVAVAAVCV